MGKLKQKWIVQQRKIEGAVSALVNGENLYMACARNLHDGILVPTQMCGCETLIFAGLDELKKNSNYV